jgi:hypothetical protein
MAVYEIKKINVMSTFKSLPVIFLIAGAIIGIITFFLFPSELAVSLNIGQKLLSWLIFVVLYTAIMSIGIALIAWLYNIVISKFNMGGVSLTLENKENN